ncbi:MAG: alpha/beta fold hydrolase [Actinobacteria bacterium]|nr:alpha/beta fold hydrolase [Actinomycetota bacterium]
MPDAMRDELFRAQWLRAVGYAPYGGADTGECFAVAERISRLDATLWNDTWRDLADRLNEVADRQVDRGDRHAARGSYLRASNAYRTAGLFLYGAPLDQRLVAAHCREVEAFRRGVALLDVPPEIVEVPSSIGLIPGYFFRPDDDGRPRPTMILTTGYDGTAEELYFTSGAAALERGYNVLTFDGPGQGTMLIDRGTPLRPDWEAAVSPVVDWLVARADVDRDAIVLMGISLGGLLAPLAATREHRLAACISDCGPYDLFTASVQRVPGFLARELPDGNPRLLGLLRRILGIVMRKPTAGWALRRNLLVHGLDDPLAFFADARRYSLRGREDGIRCPTLVCTTDRDDLSAAAPEFFDALQCEKRFVRFAAADGAGEHCESGARVACNDTVFDWLGSLLDGSS